MKKIKAFMYTKMRDIDLRIYWICSMYRIGRRLGKSKAKALIAAIRAK